MLDRIQNSGLENINQGQSLEKIASVNTAETIDDNDREKYLIDESDISAAAMEKYQRELDINKFSAVLKEIDQTEANSLVLQNVFEGNFGFIQDDDILNSLSNNENFLNDVFELEQFSM